MEPQRAIDHQGCRLSYDIRGAGPPVLMIQGVGVHGAGWTPQIDGLAARCRCLSFDHRGMGRSQPAGAPITVEEMADDARAILDQEGWRSAHVVGHSLGGMVALQLALNSRERIRSLSLLCTFASGRDAAPLTLRMAWAGARSRIGIRRMRRRGFLGLVMAPGTLAETDSEVVAARLAPLFGHDLADQPPIVDAQLRAMRACDLSARLGELAGLPTLIVAATHDPIAPPRAGRAMASPSLGRASSNCPTPRTGRRSSSLRPPTPCSSSTWRQPRGRCLVLSASESRAPPRIEAPGRGRSSWGFDLQPARTRPKIQTRPDGAQGLLGRLWLVLRGDAVPDKAKVVEEARRIIASGQYTYGQSRAQGWQTDGMMDCSEFVYQSYRNAGFLTFLPTSSSNMNTTLTTVTAPQPGDIVYWPGHVGIVEDPKTGDFLNAMSKQSGIGRANYKTDTYWRGRVGRKFLRFAE